MNTAISVYRRLNEEFLSNFPQFDDHGEIIDYLFNGYSDSNYDSHDQDFATYTGSNFKLTSKVFFCDLVYDILTNFFMGGEVAFYQGDQARTTGLPFSDDEKVLMKCLSLFAMANANCSGKFFNDQLIQALHVAKKDKTVYTWVVSLSNCLLTLAVLFARSWTESLMKHRSCGSGCWQHWSNLSYLDKPIRSTPTTS